MSRTIQTQIVCDFVLIMSVQKLISRECDCRRRQVSTPPLTALPLVELTLYCSLNQDIRVLGEEHIWIHRAL